MKTFDAESHQYRVPSIGRLPGATDVIKTAGLISLDWCSEDAMWRGKCVHRGIELFNRGTLDWDTVDPNFVGYLKSYEKFLLVTGFEVVGAEEPCFDDAFACMPDLWGILNKLPVIVELKTGPVPAWAALQTALQRRALKKDKGFIAVKRFGLRLMADGSLANLRPFEDRDDERVAMGQVDSFHWKLNHRMISDWK